MQERFLPYMEKRMPLYGIRFLFPPQPYWLSNTEDLRDKRTPLYDGQAPRKALLREVPETEESFNTLEILKTVFM